MITYTIDRFPDGWTAHRWDNAKVLSLIGTGRGPIAALTDLIEKEKERGLSPALTGAGLQGDGGGGGGGSDEV